MAILATLFAFLGRQLQRILTTVLGWASTLLFGRVPADRQLILVLVTFAHEWLLRPALLAARAARASAMSAS